MRNTIALGLAAILLLVTTAGPSAAGSAPVIGSISGVARDSRGANLVNAGVRIRNATHGDVVAQLRTGAGGVFSTAGLIPGAYIVEALGWSGEVIGVSPAVSVIAGRTANVTILAGGAQSQRPLSQAGFSLFGLGTAASWGVVAAAATATIVTVAVVANDDTVTSPSQ